MKYIDAKTIIQSNHNFNLIKGCTYGCIYCDSRSLCYQIKDFEDVSVKKNAIEIMSKELLKKRKKVILTTGAMSDPYVHIEKELKLMRHALQLIDYFGFGIAVLTKSDMILRDIDLYERINYKHKAIVCMTITTTNDDLAKIIEPLASLPSRRLEVLKEFAKKHITTGIWMTPILPWITDTEANIIDIVKKAHAAGVKYIMNFGIGTTMRIGSREYFYKNLDRFFPDLKQKYIETYGNKYICLSPNHQHLQDVFERICDAYHIQYKHEEITKIFEAVIPHQISIFD